MTSDERLTVTFSNEADETIATVVGEIDLSTGTHLEGEVRAALFAAGSSNLVLDLAGVRFIDSSGLRVILDLYRTLREQEGHLLLRHPNETVTRLLGITKLGDVLDIEV